MNLKELQNKQVWCLARCTQENTGAWKKQPYTLQGNQWKRGGQNQCSNLVTYSVATEALKHADATFCLGLVLVDTVCIDIDHISPSAEIVKDILQKTGAYADASVSGNGVHIYGTGTLPGDKTQVKFPLDAYGYPGSVLEAYTSKVDADADTIEGARFMVFTEEALPECGVELPDLTSIIQTYCGQSSPEQDKSLFQDDAPQQKASHVQSDAQDSALTWDSVFTRNDARAWHTDYMQSVQRRCTRDAYFSELWTGDIRDGAYIQDGKQILPRASSSDKSESATDMQLMTRLMYITFGDASAAVDLFKASPYYNSKDSTRSAKCKRADYMTSLVDKAANYYRQHPPDIIQSENAVDAPSFSGNSKGPVDAPSFSGNSKGPDDAPATVEHSKAVGALLQGASLSHRLVNYSDSLKSENTTQIATGIDALDGFTQGGLYSGLHFLGALPGKGKTALTLQIALNVVRQHQPVFYFTFEASGTEIASRLLLLEGYTRGHFAADAKDGEHMDALHWGTYQGVAKLSKSELEHLQNTSAVLQSDCRELYVVEYSADAISGVNSEIDFMQCVLEEYIHMHPDKPPALVVVDYLQLISASQGSTAKEGVDATLKQLHYLAKHRCNAVYLVISNFNRDSYSQRPTFASFKESGSIEYYGDTIMTLFPVSLLDVKGVNPQDKAFASQANAGAGSPKDIDEQGNKLVALDMLKNRRGKTGTASVLHFDAKHGYFTSVDYTAYLESKKKQQKKRTL